MSEKEEEAKEENKAIEVVVTNPSKDTRDKRYDSKDDPEYDDMGITDEELKEFNDGNT